MVLRQQIPASAALEGPLRMAARCAAAMGPDRDIDLEISVLIDFREAFGDHRWSWTMDRSKVQCDAGSTLDPLIFIPHFTGSKDAACYAVTRLLKAKAYELECAERIPGGRSAGRCRILGPDINLVANAANAPLAILMAVLSAPGEKLRVRSGACAA